MLNNINQTTRLRKIIFSLIALITIAVVVLLALGLNGKNQSGSVGMVSANDITVTLQYGRSIPELNFSSYTGARDVGIDAEAPGAGYYQQGAATQISYRFKRFGLYWFDLSAIPSGAVISDARLVLYSVPSQYNFNVAGAVPIYLVQTLAPNNNVVWSEGSGTDYYAQYQGTSWSAKDNVDGAKPRYPWSSLSGWTGVGDLSSAYESSPIGNMNFGSSYGAQQSDNLAPAISRIISNNYQYEGLAVDRSLLAGDTGRQDAVATKEYTDMTKRPTLQIVYSLSASATPSSVTCTPNWSCGTSWSACAMSGTQTRSCTDTNTCGVTTGKPAENQLCTYISPASAVIPAPVIMTASSRPASIPNNYIIEYADRGLTAHHLFASPTDAFVTSPAQGILFYEPYTGTQISRLTDNNDIKSQQSGYPNITYPYAGYPARGVQNLYNKYSAENITGEYAFVQSGSQSWINMLYRLADHHPMGPVRRGASVFLGLQETNDARWDRSNRPGTQYDLYYQVANKIYKQNVLTGYTSETLVYATTSVSSFHSMDHSDQDEMAHYRAINLGSSGGYQTYIVNLYTGTTLPGAYISSCCNYYEGDISPSGQWAVGALGGSNQMYSISDLAVGVVAGQQVPYSNGGHDGWAYDTAGNEVYLYQAGDDWFSAYDPVHHTRIKIISLSQLAAGSSANVHIGRSADATKPGWMLLSTYTSRLDTQWSDNQIFMVEVKDYTLHPRIWRIASTYNHFFGNSYDGGSGYFNQGFATLNNSGTAVYVGGNWFGTTNIDDYKIDLPADWWQVLGGINPPVIPPADTIPPQIHINTPVFSSANWLNQLVNTASLLFSSFSWGKLGQ